MFRSIRRESVFSALLGICAFGFGARACFALEEVSVTDEPVHLGTVQMDLMSSMRAMQGSFDPYGQYQAFPDGSTAWNSMTSLGATYRFDKKWEGSISGQFMKSDMTFPTGEMSSTSVMGPLVDVRYHLGLWPHLIVHVGASPGWSMGSHTTVGNPTAALPDDFGDGNIQGASVHAGIGGARSIGRFRFAFDINSVLPFATTSIPSDAPPTTAAPVTTRPGDRFLLSQGIAYKVSSKWTVNGGFRQSWGADTSADDVPVDGTASRLFSSDLGVSYSPDASWRWMASYDTQFPFYNYVVNGSYSPAVSLGLTYAGI
jgi:hypothetical protein